VLAPHLTALLGVRTVAVASAFSTPVGANFRRIPAGGRTTVLGGQDHSLAPTAVPLFPEAGTMADAPHMPSVNDRFGDPMVQVTALAEDLLRAIRDLRTLLKS
jgi:hypothetical protein